MALTVRKAAALMRRGEKGRHLDSGISGERGLYLEIGGRTNAHWLLRYQLGHRTRWMGLGSARTFSLDQARARAKVERQKLADKIDPLQVRRAERAKAAAAPETLDVRQGGAGVFRSARSEVDKQEARSAIPKHAEAIRVPAYWRARCRRDQYAARAGGP